MTAQALDPHGFPLHGSRMIEASAGTGKTWTIASLYLRLVLGHGTGGPEGTAFPRPLAPEEILVMTFTRAATRELGQRIRSRLVEAARLFRGEHEAKPEDQFLRELIKDYPEGPTRERAAWRLATAADAMDDAAVMTIDAWCQRMLNEHAFDTGHPFDETLNADEAVLIAEAVRDYWRQHCYPLSGEALDRVTGLWTAPEALTRQIRPLIGQKIMVRVPPPATLEGDLKLLVEEALDSARSRLMQLSEGWVEKAQRIGQWIDRELADRGKLWNARLLQKRYYSQWLEQLENWARNPTVDPPPLQGTALRRLSINGMLEAYRGDIQTLELPSEFDELSKIVAEVNDLPDIRVLLLQHAAYHVGQGLAELKRRSRSFSFSDMTERLGAALRGPRAEQLRAGMLRQFPVILIDEFQDTSPSQYRLFDSLYRTADNHRETALILIGDPKQSIYAFRGADIYSYLKARHATEGRHYALAINHRSTFEMVAAVNAWFALAESRSDAAADARHAAGAFRMRGPDTQPMPFTRVAARGRAEHFQSARGREPALTIAHDLEPRSRDDIKRRYADLCAERIVLWLNDEQAGFKTPEKSFTRLRPSDIAVLVKTRFEAAAVRTALRERGVASVFQSDRESIFASDEAEDLLRWLRAFASPGDSGLVRAALATRTLGFGVEALEAVIRDDDAFDALAETFKEINEVWRQRGVLATIRRSLHAWDLPARWLEHHDGERRLTNVLHLAELLQQASVELDGEQSLIRWLAQQIEADLATEAEEQVLRLESDADLIQIVTVHKSKGLEYPVVCLPFSSLVKRLDPKLTRFIDVVDDSGDRAIQLDFDASDFATADLERQREELRLFYVALTRAQHAVWMGFSCLGVGKALECTTHFSAPGYLLGGPEPRRAPEWLEALNALAHLAPPASIECVAASAERSSLSQLNRAEVKAPLAAPLLFDQVIERDWRAGSFTYLIRNMADTLLAATLRHRPADDERQAPGVSTESDSSAASSSAGLPVTGPEVAHSQPESAPPWPQTAAIRLETAAWHRFPPGARSGDFIHGVLEAVAEEGFQLSGHSRLRELILDRCDRHGHADRADDVLGWMQALTDTRLPSLGARLAEVRHSLSEMEFWMPAHRLRADRIDALCREHLLRGRARPELPEKGLNGMLMGFADLVFEHGGRYWVLDYKTNRLSIDADLERAYDTESLEAEMARHRYDVQAALYLLALHRQLRTRLRHRYDPEKHLGGALYWFVRGLEGPVRGEYAVLMDDSLLTLIDALDRMLSGEGERL